MVDRLNVQSEEIIFRYNSHSPELPPFSSCHVPFEALGECHDDVIHRVVAAVHICDVDGIHALICL